MAFVALESGKISFCWVEDSNIKALLRILDLGPEDFKALAAAFEEDGNVEIDGIIEADGKIGGTSKKF